MYTLVLLSRCEVVEYNRPTRSLSSNGIRSENVKSQEDPNGFLCKVMIKPYIAFGQVNLTLNQSYINVFSVTFA